MDEELLYRLEHQLSAEASGAPRELRGAVLSQVERELRAARWDRRLVRCAGGLLLVGVALNLSLGLSHDSRPSAVLAGDPAAHSLMKTAVAIAEATDAETGSRFARQMAILNGWPLNAEQAAAIDAAIAQQNPRRL